MASLTLRISLEGGRVTKTIQFDPNTTIFDACRIIREKFGDAVQGAAQEYGLFLSDEDNKQGVWLEQGRNLGYYMLRNQDVLEYRRKLRTLRVRMLDGALKTILVDDSQPVIQMMVVICTKIGITNHEEYGLVREEYEQQNENYPDNHKSSGFSTLTLKRKTTEKERDAKMESLRKKLKTDDEINWIDPGKTLREQGIDESETVLLRRKFFFSDQNIDSRDPVQLNLLYVQARDAILDGTHPVTQDKACEFSGLQAQIQFGDYNEQKHKPGFLDLKEFLPQSYLRVKGIEKKIFSEHKRHYNLSEVDAKVMYTKTARELPTYGVTFFLVKEKMPGKNKLVPRLLGVTKDSVLRLDEHTKEILKSWPLTTVRRWGASPNTFTLDFGDYADQYYSVQTTEAEQIVQLIAGYIDIILKKKQSKDHFGIEGDEGSTMVEESVAPSKATFLQHETTNRSEKLNTESLAKPVIMRGSDGEKTYTHSDVQTVQYGAVVGQVNVTHQPPTLKPTRVSTVLSEPQRALLGYISAGQEAITKASEELMTKAPDLDKNKHSIEWRENTFEMSKQTVTTHIANMNAATAQVVTASQPDDVDSNAMSAAVSQIAQTIPEVTKEVRLIAALMDDDPNGDKLLEATRKLINAFSDLLKAAEPESQQPRQNLLNAASRVGEASGHVLNTITEETQENREMYDMLLGLAKAVANTTAALVLRAKSIAASCEDDEARNKVIGAASQCALATSQLVACARVVAPTLHNEACREQLEAAAREVAKAVTNLVGICNETTDNQQLKGDLLSAAREVSRTLNDLLEHIKLCSRERARSTSEEHTVVDSVLVVSDRLVSSSDPQEMVRQANTLGHATAQLIANIKFEAENQSDTEIQRRLLAAAKQLADATARLIEAAHACSTHPNDANNQEALRTAAEELRDITATAAHTPAVRSKLIKRLEQSSKNAASAARDCIASSRKAIQFSEDKHSKEVLLQDCQTVNDLIPNLVTGMKNAADHPDDPSSQLNLIESAEQFLEPGSQLGQSARSLQPTVHDSVASQQLSKSAYNLSQSIHELRVSTARAREACGGQELESALEAVANMRNVLNETRCAVAERTLRPLPGETAEGACHQLVQSTKKVGIAMTQLLSSVSQGNRSYAGVAGRDTAIALGDFTKNVRGVAATTGSPIVVDCADDVIISSIKLIEEAQRTLQNVGDPGMLTQAARDVTHSLSKTVDCLPGQRDVDEALRSLTELSEVLSLGEFPPTDKTYAELQAELKQAAEKLNYAGGQIVQSHASSTALASTSKDFNESYRDLLTVSLEMAGQTQDEVMRENVLTTIRQVSSTSIHLLTSAKSVAADPQQINGKHQLTAAARAVTESINQLVDSCTSAAPGQKECDNAIRTIDALRPLLESANEPITDQGYSECLQSIVENSKKLGTGMSGMANHAKLQQRVDFCYTVNSVAESIRGMIESAGQASYLIGVSEPTSVAGRPGLVDHSQLVRRLYAIKQSCDVLKAPSANHQQIVSAATVIAKHTSALCNACRSAGQYTTNPVAKKEFVQAGKDLAHSTSKVVEQIKALDKGFTPEAHSRCAETTGPLLDALNSLYQFASSPEFISVPARISAEGRQSQEPILQGGRNVLDGIIDLIKSVKSLIISPQNPAIWQQISVHSRFISDNYKNIVAYMQDHAPGQVQCDTALEQLNTCARDLDSAAMSIGMQNLQPKRENNLQGYLSQTMSSASELIDKLEPLRTAANNNTESLSHAVLEIPRYAVPLTSGSIGVSSHVVHTTQQIEVLDETKTIIESATNLIHATKHSAGTIRPAGITNTEVDEYVTQTRGALQELLSTLEKISSESGVVTGLTEQISRSMAKISDKRQSFISQSTNINESYVDYQTRMVQNAKEIARLANEINAKAAVDQSKLPQLSVDMTQNYLQLAQDSMGASATTTTPDVSIRIRTSVQDLGHSVSTLIQSSVGASKNDSGHHPEIQRNTRDVTEKVSQVLASLHAGSRGTQACINAASTVSGIIGDLDTTIMFATAGTLHSDNADGQFSDHRELILKTAKALVEDTKVLVAGAAGTQDQLAAAAQNAVTTILQLAEAVKHGACTLGSGQPDSQVMVINAVKDVAAALGELINATKLASGKPIHDPAMNDLKESAKIMVMNVTSLLKTVKAVEDEHTRGTRAMEATVEAISQEVRAMQTPDTPRNPPATPEDLIRVTKNVTFATAKAVAAGVSNLQSDIAAAANNGRRTISEMLVICKSVAWSCAETTELRQRTLVAGAAVANSYRDLLEGVLRNCTADERMHLSRRVAKCVTDLVAMAQLLKGSDWVDPEDPTVIAENELLGAAASIDAAAKKLASLRPRQPSAEVKNVDENMKFDEIILEAAKGIMAASSALVRAANAAQRELIDQGKVAKRPLTSSDDGQWSEGLISAARLVAAATHSLVEAAQNLVQGISTEELLISTAKQVASSTAQLLIACKVKSDPNSESGRRLQAAGNAVIKSTDNLVRAAQQAIDMEEEHTLRINTSMVDGMTQEINARSEVLKRERELEAARNKLTAIRQAKYRQRVAQGYTDDSDSEQPPMGCQSPTSMLTGGNRSYNANNSTSPSNFLNTSTSTPYGRPSNDYSPKKSPYTGMGGGSSTIDGVGHTHFSGGTTSPYNDPTIQPTPSSPYHIKGSTLSPANKTMLKNNLESCIQDLHEKTFGRTDVAPMTTFKYNTNTTTQSTGGSGADNYSSQQHHMKSSQNQYNQHQQSGGSVPSSQHHQENRYETRSFNNTNLPPPPPITTSSSSSNHQTEIISGGGGTGDLSTINNQFSEMKLISDNNGKLNLIDSDGSARLTSMTQRVLERKTMTTTTEMRTESKTAKHNFRLE